jgi:hypothetical protein
MCKTSCFLSNITCSDWSFYVQFGELAQWHNGTMAQRHNSTTEQRHKGTMAQRHNGTTAQQF